MALTILVFILLLSLLVLIHEFGHFIVAKKLGIKVEEFGWGFPPRVWGIKKGETVYSINLLPIGGFVKLYGEDDAGGGKVGSAKVSGAGSKDIKRAYFARPAWQRFAVVVAGVVMNILLAFVLFYAYLAATNFKTILPLVTDYTFSNVTQTNYQGVIIQSISPNSPAEKIGMQAPAQVINLNGEKVGSLETFIKEINDNKGKEITLTWKELRTGEVYTNSVVPRENPPEHEGALGIGLDYIPMPIAALEYETPVQKAFSGITYSYDLVVYQVLAMRDMVGKSVAEKNIQPVSDNVAGPVGLFMLVDQLLSINNLKVVVLQTLNFAGLLSLSLAFFNILPIPALDGGRLFFIIIEMVSRRKINPRFESMAHAIGFAMLMGLIILILFSDIAKFFR